MAAPTWRIENYNAFLREAMSTYDIGRDEAREVYREFREILGPGVYGADIKNEPTLAVNVGVDYGYYLEEGTELELTATTEGKTPRRR